MKHRFSAALVVWLGLWLCPADGVAADSMSGGGVSSSGSQPWIGNHNNMPRQTLSPAGTVFTPPTSFGNFWILNNAAGQSVACPPDIADGDSLNVHIQYGAAAPYSPAISFSAPCYGWTTGTQPPWSENSTQSDSAFCQSMNPPDVTGASFVCGPQLNVKPPATVASWTLVSNAGAISSTGNNVTTAAISTTGANLIVVSVESEGTWTLSDSASNAWAQAFQGINTNNPVRVTQYYKISPTTNASHTFTVTGTSDFPSMQVQAWTKGSGTPALDTTAVNTTNSAGATSYPTGSATPAGGNELAVASLTNDNGTAIAIGSSYTISNANPGASSSHGGAMAYLQPIATAQNPTWSWTGSFIPAAGIALYK